jgi:hypothetical protein
VKAITIVHPLQPEKKPQSKNIQKEADPETNSTIKDPLIIERLNVDILLNSDRKAKIRIP